MFFKIDVPKDFAIFTGKHLCWSLFLIWFQALSYECSEIFKNTLFTEHLQWLRLTTFDTNTLHHEIPIEDVQANAYDVIYMCDYSGK